MKSFPVPGPGGPWFVGIVVPARNEAEAIEQCLESLFEALEACPRVKSSWIVVVADSCTDRTADIARARLGSQGVVIECAAQSAGIARRLGSECVLRRLAAAPRSRTWIANTDADSRVHSHWLQSQLALADAGFSGVAGIVRVESLDCASPALLRQVLEDYVVHPDGTHPHVHGANLGFRADAYLSAGGWSDLALAEDHCLWNRLRLRHWPIISTATSIVTTSGRLQGRAAGGFADSLRRHVERLTRGLDPVANDAGPGEAVLDHAGGEMRALA